MKPKRKNLNSFQGVGVVPLMKNEYLKRDLIHQHMVSHYRRLYNAKSDINTSSPQYFKPLFKPRPRPPLPKPALPVKARLTNADLDHIEELAGDNGPWWPERDTDSCIRTTEEFVESFMMSVEERPTDGKRKKAKVQHCHTFQSMSISPKSSKNNSMAMSPFSQSASKLDVGFPASSRLREMSIYHPPRRRIQKREVKEEKPSHAYCSGCLTKFNKNEQSEKAKISPGEKKESRSVTVNNIVEMQKADLKYLQFVQNITQDVLKTDVYTNECLETIFHKHILRNKDRLDIVRMQDEIGRLRDKLEMCCEASYRHSGYGSKDGNLNEASGITKETDNFSSFSSKSVSKAAKTSPDISSYKQSIPCQVLKVTKPRKVNKVNKVMKANEVNQFREYLKDTKVNEKTRGKITKANELGEEEKSEQSEVINFLENMGFNRSMAREICDCMSDKDLMNLQIPFDSEDKEWIGKLEEFEAFSFDAWNEDISDSEDSKDRFETYEPTSTSIGEGDAKLELEQLSNNSPDMKKTKKKENEKASGDGPHEALVNNANPLRINESALSETKQSNPISGTPMPGVPSPVGSDYSSMKDHDDDDNDESYESSLAAEEADEGRESASEVEEEDIPENLSVASSSSGISQLAEGLKSIELKSNKSRHETNVPCPRTIKI